MVEWSGLQPAHPDYSSTCSTETPRKKFSEGTSQDSGDSSPRITRKEPTGKLGSWAGPPYCRHNQVNQPPSSAQPGTYQREVKALFQ